METGTWGPGLTPVQIVGLAALSAVLFVAFAAGTGLAWQGRQVRRALTDAGETLVLGPRGALCWQRGDRPSLQALVVAVLTERRLIFRSVLGGKAVDLPLSRLRSAAETHLETGERRSGGIYLALQPAEGEEIRLMLPDSARWLAEVTARIKPEQGSFPH